MQSAICTHITGKYREENKEGRIAGIIPFPLHHDGGGYVTGM
jgi:hypothetical protein